MYLTEALDTIREKLLAASLWTTILVQIRDGGLADAILEVIDDFLDGKAMNSMWEETDMQSEYGADEIHPLEVQQDLRMELLDEVTKLAWDEAKR